MNGDDSSLDEEQVRALDQRWDEVYGRNDRSAFAEILADDFWATLPDGATATKADMMRPTPAGASVRFSEREVRVFTPAAVTRGRVLIGHADRIVDQRYVRVYSKRNEVWQAVTVFVFPVSSPA